MQLEELFNYKNKLMEDLLTNESIVHLIDEDVNIEEAEKLAYTQVFPYEEVVETIERGKVFICFDLDIQRSVGSAPARMLYEPVLYVWVFAHQSRMRLPGGGVRTDALCSEICKVLNGSRKYGLGELNLYAVKRFAPLMDIHGKCMTFQAKDISKVYDPTRAIPDNRRE